MPQFSNVAVATAANILFEGNITSRAIVLGDGSKKALGIMLPGEYELTSIHKEVMDIQRGKLDIKLPAEDWVRHEGKTTFEIPANSRFKLRVHTLVDYCCTFIRH